MRIACLQYDPVVGHVQNNITRAEVVLNEADPADLENINVLVLPELAFTGYNFRSLKHILPFLEISGCGISSAWAKTTALRLDCTVVVGYPEKVDVSTSWPASPEFYNATIVTNRNGETVANYRKTFLYHTDETWALEGNGFFYGDLDGLGEVAMGICMDINPYRFEAPWDAFEFAYHILEVEANLVIVSMSWVTREESSTFIRHPAQPDMESLAYWVQRLEPVIRAERSEEIIVVLCNRCGMEDELLYTGTSAVMGIKDGEVNVYGLLGRGTKELLVVDTDSKPFAKLVDRPDTLDEQCFSTNPVSSGSAADRRDDMESQASRTRGHVHQEGARSHGRESIPMWHGKSPAKTGRLGGSRPTSMSLEPRRGADTPTTPLTPWTPAQRGSPSPSCRAVTYASNSGVYTPPADCELDSRSPRARGLRDPARTGMHTPLEPQWPEAEDTPAQDYPERDAQYPRPVSRRARACSAVTSPACQDPERREPTTQLAGRATNRPLNEVRHTQDYMELVYRCKAASQSPAVTPMAEDGRARAPQTPSPRKPRGLAHAAEVQRAEDWYRAKMTTSIHIAASPSIFQTSFPHGVLDVPRSEAANVPLPASPLAEGSRRRGSLASRPRTGLRGDE